MKPNTSKDETMATKIRMSDPNHMRWVAGAMIRTLEQAVST